MLKKHNTMNSSYLLHQAEAVKEERNAVNLTFCTADCAELSRIAISKLALQNVWMCPAGQ